MIGKNIKYRGYSLADADFVGRKMALQDFTKTLNARGVQYPFANSFGATLGPRIAETRIFQLQGRIHDTDPQTRENKYAELANLFHIESNLGGQNIFELERETKDGKKRVASVMVFDQFSATNGICDPIIEREVTLVAPDPRIYDPLPVHITGGLAQAGADTLAHKLAQPEPLTSSNEGILCYHEGDREAPLRIEANGVLVNPRIMIVWNGQLLHYLRINKTTTSLVVDTVNTVATSSDDKFVLTDNGQSIKQFRSTQQGGGPLFLGGRSIADINSGVSTVLVLCSNYLDVKDTAEIKITYRHTYSF